MPDIKDALLIVGNWIVMLLVMMIFGAMLIVGGAQLLIGALDGIS